MDRGAQDVHVGRGAGRDRAVFGERGPPEAGVLVPGFAFLLRNRVVVLGNGACVAVQLPPVGLVDRRGFGAPDLGASDLGASDLGASDLGAAAAGSGGRWSSTVLGQRVLVEQRVLVQCGLGCQRRGRWSGRLGDLRLAEARFVDQGHPDP
jgi:hypothetical protein